MTMTAPATNKKYDVAISFLVQDSSLAQALAFKLGEGLEVFFFPHNQEELAGTDGLESMREPFLRQSRVNVVLYREKWGNTPWTAVEAAAVKDSCLSNAYRNLFFFVVEPTKILPKWLPDTHVRFNYADFTLEQAIGAIKARVQEQGGHYTLLTPVKKAQILKAEEAYQSDRSRLSSPEGMEKMLGQVDELVNEIERQCIAVNAASNLNIEYEVNPRHHCILRHYQLGLIVRWEQKYESGTQKGGLSVEEYHGRLFFQQELQGVVHIRPAEQLSQTYYNSDLSRSREYGWSKQGKGEEFTHSNTLAERLVLQFMSLIERKASGKL